MLNLMATRIIGDNRIRPLRIAFISVGVYERKLFSRSFYLARGMARLGHDVTLITCSQDYRFLREYREGVKIIATPEVISYRLRKGGLGFVDTICRCIILSLIKIDIIHVDVGFRPAGGIPGHLFSKIKHVPYVCDWWDWIGVGGLLDGRSKLYRYTLGAFDNYFELQDKMHADGVICISEYLRNRALSYGINNEQLSVVTGGCDADDVGQLDKEQVRSELGLPHNSFIIGFAGMGPHEYRDLIPFLENISWLRKEVKSFIWFSTGDKLPLDIKKYYGISTEYIETGWVSENRYKKLLAAADILLLLQEDTKANRARWPNKTGDYLAAGRPILATSVGEIGNLIREHPGGIMNVDWNKKSVRRALRDFINRKNQWDDMGNANAKLALNYLSWDIKAKQFISFYYRIINRHKK